MSEILTVSAAAPMVPQAQQAALDAHAEAIRGFGRRVVRDLIEIGEHLVQAKELCSHGEWLAWLGREFEWTDRHARNLMRAYELSLKSEHLSDLNIPISGLYLLAAPSTPMQAQQAVIAAAENGQKITVAKVKEAIAEARDDDPPPRPRHRPPPRDEPSPNLDTQLVPLARECAKGIITLMKEMTPPARRMVDQEVITFLDALMGRSGGKQ